MENWITRAAAAICAAGSVALFWSFGMFLAVPWREGRMLALNAVEFQVIGIPLVVGVIVGWGSLHIVSISDRDANPNAYTAIRSGLLIAAAAAVIGGMSWTEARIV